MRATAKHRTNEPGYRSDIAHVMRAMLASVGGVTQKTMFGVPAFYASAKVFACVFGEGIGLKLPAERAARLLALPGVRRFQPYGNLR